MYEKRTDEAPALELIDVSFRRSPAECSVLSGISLRVPAGQRICIAGVNGSGKSTLLRLMNGMLLADEGSIYVHGLCLTKESVWEIRRQVGFVFADPDHMFVGQSVMEEMAFGLQNLQVPTEEMKERIHRYAKLLGIEDLLSRHPVILSGGQKQRVALAAVLVMEPRILLLDEAASMLDEGAKNEYLQLLRQLSEQNQYTMISVTHDTDELMEADRLILLADGRIIGDGRPEEIMKREELLSICRLRTPYMLRLCKELQKQGIIMKDELVSREEVLRQLWIYALNMSSTAMGEDPPLRPVC